MRPRGPNEKIHPIAVVKGGDTSGKSTAISIAVTTARGSRARAAVNANRKPISVPSVPTRAASSRLLRNARTWLRSVRIVATPDRLMLPWSTKIRARSMASG